ncbi:gamma-glutamyl hydrolase [Lepeophtheirus salmonis]|uniref:gamma-glutamyl hydrolase n=1 Tax=Lepeophtheirus salmonis TaxID=72036 RepID=UPI001AE2C3C3|nr:gamma-glutamyl hydrolase-like [Lepeophtheirus salmonis]
MYKFLLLVISPLILGTTATNIKTYRPIIGVVAMDLFQEVNGKTTKIPASYIKFVESGGARATPVLCNQTEEYYDKIFKSTNGLLLPGGDVSLDDSCYAAVGEAILKRALNSSDYYPIWGTCLGFELLLHLTDDNRPNLAPCLSKNKSLPVKFNENTLAKSTFGKELPKDVKETLSSKNVTPNFHSFCMTMDNFTSHGLDSMWYPLSTSIDDYGLEFISIIEAIDYPFWGTQFHPEMSLFEWSPDFNSPELHSTDTIGQAQFFAKFFVQECRKNGHSFESREEEDKFSIYSFNPVFTGNTEIDDFYSQQYFFN